MATVIKTNAQTNRVSKEFLHFALICDVLKNVNYLRIFTSLVKHESLTVQDVANILIISHSSSNRYLKKLTSANILIKKDFDNLSSYSLNTSNTDILMLKNLLTNINK